MEHFDVQLGDWQLWLSLAAIAAAAFVLARRACRLVVEKGCGTGGCSSCKEADGAKDKPLVQLSRPESRAAGRESDH
jgi:hypothetical protein